MIRHLSSEQFSEYILGTSGPVVTQHVENCPACRGEVASFREALSGFRDAVRGWSADGAQAAMSAPVSAGKAVHASPSRQLALALVIALVCVIASLVAPRLERARTSASDVMLLNQVDAQISRTSPSSMEPLTKLVLQNE